MPPFAKIPLDIGFTKSARKGKHVITYGAISYYHVLGNPFPFKYLKLWAPDNVRWVEIVGEDNVHPHRDHTVQTALNCYFESGAAKTRFWEPHQNAEAHRFPGARSSNLYSEEFLSQTSEFTAQDGDAYLLDVSSIHSVEKPPETSRRFIQLTWNNLGFNEVLERIHDTMQYHGLKASHS